MYRRRRVRPLVMPEIMLAPLVDTALVLVIIFMAAMPVVHHALRMELPYGTSKESGAAQEDLVVSIERDGSVALNDQRMPLEKLLTTLATRVKTINRPVVYVAADARLTVQNFIDVVDPIKAIGGIRVAFATQPRTEHRG